MRGARDVSEREGTNAQIAEALEHTADLLETQGESPFRVRSYRDAADRVRTLQESIRDLIQQKGTGALEALPGIGEKLAGAIREIATTGHLSLEDRLESEISRGRLFTRVPGIGEALARRIHRRLAINSLEELETAAHDGRLERYVEGIGAEKAEGIRLALSGMLSRSLRQQRQETRSISIGQTERPSVELLLDIDRMYRRKAERGQLRTIAPKRFNPGNEAWLPIMQVARDGWEFTLLFSNTARAHESGKIHDWVVIYYERDLRQRQCAVVTAERGELKGRRIIRGREPECRRYYRL